MIRLSRHPGRQCDEGFTLIELLVVMVIIGILAAIAIPSFLAQKDKAYQAAEKSDLKTASIAERAYSTDNNGQYTADAGVNQSSPSTDPLVAQGMVSTTGVTVSATLFTTIVANDSYCLKAVDPSRTTVVMWSTSNDDTPVPAKPAVCP